MTQLAAQVRILLDASPYDGVMYNNFFSSLLGYELGGRFIGSVKEADASLKKSRDE
jgi:hypothetical protein